MAMGTCQVLCWPSQVPAGTPSTRASEPATDSAPTTRPRTSGANRPTATGPITAQNSAWASAVNSRAARSSQ